MPKESNPTNSHPPLENTETLRQMMQTFLGLSLAAFEKPTNLLNKRISHLENFGLVLVFVWLFFIDLHYLVSEPLGDHVYRVEFIQAFSFVIRHKVGSNNQVADALSFSLLVILHMHIRVQGFDSFRGLYCDDPDFREIWSKCDNGPSQQFSKLDGYLFIGVGLLGPRWNVMSLVIVRCRYMPHCQNSYIVLQKRFDASKVARLYFAEIVKLHDVPKTLTSDREVKFVSQFWRTFLNWGQCLIHWDLILPQAEFAYSRSVNRTTGKSPFEVVYERNPITPLDLVPVPEVGRFNLSSYKGDSDDEPDSGSSFFQEGEDDADAVNKRVNVINTLGAYFLATNLYGGLG
ncbi:RNA-directed DNA polymerase [Tanacetum coccineum]|uniref:RNA-directed DNA polymerase n=1 Tax=Tanacetum coccineum TaxID=301880 RepID=A0ABQ5BQB4_9ASTR